MKTKLTLLLVLLAITLSAQTYPEMIKVEGGTFTMGDELGFGNADEQPTHQVTLSTYYISKTEVTVVQYNAYCKATGVKMPEEPSWGWQSNDPIVNVSWDDAMAYCDWLAEKYDKNYLLPTEAQWEYATRGGNKSRSYKYSGGRSLGLVGWYSDNSDGKAHTVGTKKANELGLYDMCGNVWEWCLDAYNANFYANSPAKNPKNMKGKNKILRGGSWNNGGTNCRVALRDSYGAGDGLNVLGFRVVYF